MLRPNLVAALIAKAAARTEIASGPASARHCDDVVVVLANLISARDFRDTELTTKDRTRLTGWSRSVAAKRLLWLHPAAWTRFTDSERAAQLTTEA